MRIALVTATIAPDAMGGRGKYARELYDALRNSGVDVSVITGLWSQKLDDPKIMQIKIPKIRYLWVPFFIRRARALIKKNTFDVIHTNGDRESLVCSQGTPPCVTTIHDLGAQQMKMHLLSNIMNRNVSEARFIITPSQTVKEELCNQYPSLSPESIIPVHNGINTTHYHAGLSGESIRDRYNIQGPLILYLGRIAKYKGIEDILTAYKQLKLVLPDASLIVAGGVMTKMRHEYQQWKHDYPDVIFTGRVTDDEVPLFYTAADIFVTYSYAGEGFGLTIAEAMACGTPVICSDLPAYREVVNDFGVLVPPQRPTELAKAMISTLTDKDHLHSLGENGARYIRDRFSWEKSAQAHLAVYQRVLEDG